MSVHIESYLNQLIELRKQKSKTDEYSMFGKQEKELF